MIHTYWLKKPTPLHERLAAQMNQLLISGTHPEWLTQSWTVLIMKDPQKGTRPSNYGPLTCLSTTWMRLSGITETKVSRHMDQYMIRAQKELDSNTRGVKHQLLVDRTVARNCSVQENQPVHCWTDYKKALGTQCHTHGYWSA